MILTIIHKPNQILEPIVSFMENRGTILSFKEEIIGTSAYSSISAKCGVSDREYLINSPQSIKNTFDPNLIQQIININGIGHRNASGITLGGEFDVLVFEMSIISIKQKLFGKASTQIKYVEESQVKKIADLAKRVVYLLGLDYGMVKIVLTEARRAKVLSVNSSPLIRDKDVKALLRKFDRVIANTESIGNQEVKMGADPEFMLANAKNGRMVPASQFFPREGSVGCDNIRIPSRQQRPVAELRPKPDYSPLQLFANLKQTLYSANALSPYKNIKWLAGSQPFSGYSIGGHIHFSNVSLSNHVLRALDNYVGLPLFLIENQISAVKRREKYGFLADFRTKDYGGFEYRTPASWLVSPEIAKAVFCLGKIVTSNYLQLTRNSFITAEAQRAFYQGDQDYLRPLFKDHWADIQKLSMYNSFAEELDLIAYMIQNDIHWDERADIRKAWGITNVSRSEYKNARLARNSSPVRTQSPVATVNSSRNSSNRNRRSSNISREATSSPVYTSTHRYYN